MGACWDNVSSPLFFFFSSRRRHTRCSRDWSSDVCSSDLVPFAALHDGRNFLIERYATAIAPSMHLIDPKPLAAGPRVALVLGVSQAVQGFVDLPNVPREVASVHDITGGQTLIDASFSTARFASELKASTY